MGFLYASKPNSKHIGSHRSNDLDGPYHVTRFTQMKEVQNLPVTNYL